MAQARRKRREIRARRQAEASRGTKAAPEEEVGGSRRGWQVALVAGAVVVLVAGGLAYALFSGGSSAAGQQAVVVSDPMAALAGHPLQAPECTPVKGVRWVYPKGPPVRGLPPIEAKISSNIYEVFAIKYPCAEASAWIHKLSRTKIPILHSGNVTVLWGTRRGTTALRIQTRTVWRMRAPASRRAAAGCVVGKECGGPPVCERPGKGCKLTAKERQGVRLELERGQPQGCLPAESDYRGRATDPSFRVGHEPRLPAS